MTTTNETISVLNTYLEKSDLNLQPLLLAEEDRKNIGKMWFTAFNTFAVRIAILAIENSCKNEQEITYQTCLIKTGLYDELLQTKECLDCFIPNLVRSAFMWIGKAQSEGEYVEYM